MPIPAPPTTPADALEALLAAVTELAHVSANPATSAPATLQCAEAAWHLTRSYELLLGTVTLGPQEDRP